MKLCLTGDAILMDRMPQSYTGLGPVEKFIRQGDVRVSNMEMVLSRGDCWASTYCGGVWLTARPEVLDDVLKFGFNCFTFANNHTMDYGCGGMESTLRAIARRGVPVCGAGMSLAQAAAPVFVDTPAGRAAVLSVTSTCDDAARAGDPREPFPPRPGVNMLRHSETYLVSPGHMRALEEIAAATHVNGRIDNSKRGGYTVSRPGIFDLGTLGFAVSETEGKRSAPHPLDMERMRAAVARASREAEHTVVCFHSHEIRGDVDEEPDEFIETFAHACIDWGASAVVGSGTHQIKAVELYRGRPIFYSIANFIFQSEAPRHLPADYYDRYGIDRSKTAAEAVAVRSQGGTRGLEADPVNYRGLVPLLEFDGPRLARITIQPVELGFADPTAKGLPRPADEATAEEVLDTLERLSAPYGTRFTRRAGQIEVDLNDRKEKTT